MNIKIIPDHISEILGEKDTILISYIMKELKYDNLIVRDLDREELSILVSEAFSKIEKAKNDQSGPSKLEKWNFGWGENLKLLEQNIDVSEALKPGYYRSNNIIRFGKKWVYSEDTNIEYKLFEIIRSYLFQKYLKNYESVYEFGCGSVHNLYHWSQMDPKKEYFGFDWADPVLEIGKKLSKHGRIKTFKYDFYKPTSIKNNFKISSNSCAITVGSMEQMGKNFKKFINILLESNYDMVIHVEPIIEFLDDTILTDYVAKSFMINRNYLNGLKSYLDTLNNKNMIQLISSQKVELCGMMNLGWNILVWKK